MSIRVSRRAPKGAVAMVGLVAAAVALSGCSSLGSRTFGDPTTTASVPQSAPAANYSQPMPSSLGGPQNMVAESRFLPPANVGGGWNAPTNTAVQPAWNQPAAGYTQPMATAMKGTTRSGATRRTSAPAATTMTAAISQNHDCSSGLPGGIRKFTVVSYRGMPRRAKGRSLQALIAEREQSRGLLIAFEGPEGSGKTTQRKLLQRWLESRDQEVVSTRWASSFSFEIP